MKLVVYKFLLRRGRQKLYLMCVWMWSEGKIGTEVEEGGRRFYGL